MSEIPTTITDTIKIKNSKAIELYSAIESIQALSQAPKAVFALAKNSTTLEVIRDDVEKARKKLWVGHFGDEKSGGKGHPKFLDYLSEYQAVLDTEVEFKPHRFSLQDFNLDVNVVSPAALQRLFLLMTGV
jgi:hypothetical protein